MTENRAHTFLYYRTDQIGRVGKGAPATCPPDSGTVLSCCMDPHLDHHQGEVPSSREALEALPGVGRKTANVVLNTAFGQPTMAVDTHIFRVANRTGLARGKTPLAVEQGLLKNIDKEFLQDAHHWLILHGRYVCVARKPHCSECLIRDLCEFKPEP